MPYFAPSSTYSRRSVSARSRGAVERPLAPRTSPESGATLACPRRRGSLTILTSSPTHGVLFCGRALGARSNPCCMSPLLPSAPRRWLDEWPDWGMRTRSRGRRRVPAVGSVNGPSRGPGAMGETRRYQLFAGLLLSMPEKFWSCFKVVRKCSLSRTLVEPSKRGSRRRTSLQRTACRPPHR